MIVIPGNWVSGLEFVNRAGFPGVPRRFGRS